MEDSLEGLLQALKKPQNSKKLVQVLAAIRKQVNAPYHRSTLEVIRKYNYLKLLIGYTKFDDNIYVIDLTLSILGNCCLNSSIVRLSVNEFNILEHMLRVLEKHKKDSIQGKVFRILGNICDSIEPIQVILKEPKVVHYLAEFLKNYNAKDFTIPTIGMALRFARKLLVMATFKVLAKDFQLIKAFGVVLRYITETFVQTKNSTVVNDALKIFQVITSSISMNYDIILDLKNAENGDALKCLTQLILFSPEKIVKITLKLAKVSKHLSDLPIEGILVNLMTNIEQDSKAGSNRQRELLACMCKLLDHLGFQESFKHQDLITRLIRLLNGYDIFGDTSIQCCIYICSALNKCKYNEALVKLQLDADIIHIIIDKMSLLTRKSTEQVSTMHHAKKEYSLSGQHSQAKRFKKGHVKSSAFSIFDPCSSNERCASPSSCSDISSCGPYSPMAVSESFGNESDSDNYSPLCSEAECDEEDKDNDNDEIQDLIQSDNDEHRPTFSLGQNELRTKFREELCDLLKVYCTIKPLHRHLGDTKLLILLLNIIFDGGVNEDKAEKEHAIIRSISLCREFFIDFMVSGVIAQVYDVLERKHGDTCLDCNILHHKCQIVVGNFVSSGQSENIKGEIAFILQSHHNKDMKNKIALAIPYVIRNKISLMKLMIDCGGLNLIIQLLKAETNRASIDKYIKSICTLATINLSIKNPVQKKQTKKHKSSKSSTPIKVSRYVPPETCENEVTFLMDDGSEIKGDRCKLSEKSDYFNALLCGSFCESLQTEIQIRNIQSESFQCLMQLLSCDVTLSSILDTEYELEVLLDVILISDRFLLSELNYSLVNHVEQQISMKSLPAIYKWSIESGTNILRIESVAFALVSDNTFKERLDMFYNLLDTGYYLELVDDVHKLVLQFL